jgi:hypothetical protein
MTNYIYDKTVRKWIHKFNDCSLVSLFTKVDYSNTVKINDKGRKEILHISSISPRALGLKFSTWSRSIAGYMKEKKIVKVDGISHTTVRDIMRIWIRVGIQRLFLVVVKVEIQKMN